MIRKVDRRGFLKGLAAGGLLLALDAVLPACAGADTSAMGAANKPSQRTAFDPLVWLAIAPDGATSVVVARSEMGQGARSTLAYAIIDELEADRKRVRLIQADGDEKRYGSQNTDGSRSIRHDLENVRRIGAAARQMLEAAAAERWGVPVAEVEARDHAVHHAKTGRKAGYGELAEAAWKRPLPDPVVLKPREKWKWLGKEHMPGFDLHGLVTGKAGFGADVVLPGMKYAVVARPPVYGGKVAKLDDAEARKTPGVERTVTLPAPGLLSGFRPVGGVAVVAKNTWAALEGRKKLEIQWDDGGNRVYDSVEFRGKLEKTVRRPGKVVMKRGEVEKAFAKAHRRITAEYYVPHLVHAPMEPLVATARVQGGRCEVWAPTQHPQAARDELAAALGLKVEDVTVHVTMLGGGFGRKSKPDFIVEAALIAREVGAPVKVQWTREDEIQHGYYHTVTAQHLEAGLDELGRVQAWLHRTAFPSIVSTFVPGISQASDAELGMGVTDLPYDVPNVQQENGSASAHVRIGWFRSVANIQHAFAVNSFVAELAAAAGRDPKDFMLELLGPARRFPAPKWNYGASGKDHPVDTARLRRVIELAAQKAGWGRPMRPGHGLGIAAHRSFLSYVATVVEVRVDHDGTVHVPSVHSAIDCGFAANPDRIRAQMEGAAVMGLSAALHGAITFKEGRVEQSNFHDYQLVRIGEAPRVVHTHIVESGDPPGGVGEPGVPPFAAALCNAIHAAVGKRIRVLPIGDQLAPRA